MTPPTAFYQVYASAFHPGGLTGIGQTAPYLASLGVDALVTQPVSAYPPNATDRYYSPCDHGSVDPSLGGPEAIQELNRTLREHGITAVGDLVLNHVDRAGWIVERAIAEPEDYAAWLRLSRDPVGHHWPEKLVNIFGRPQWTEVSQLGGFVATPFYDDQYTLNFEHEPLIRYINGVAGGQMLDTWGYSALRLDAAASVDPIDLTDAPAVNQYGRVAPHPVALRFMEQFRENVLRPRGAWAIAEAGGSPEYMRALMASPGVDYAYDVSWWAVILHAALTGRWDALREHLAEQAPDTWDRHIRYLGSHDERQARFTPQRAELIAAYGGRDQEYVCFGGNGLTRRMRDMLPSADAHAMAVGLTALMPGVPLYYQGDLEGLRGDSSARKLDVRDPNRCRMPWDAAKPNAGWGAAASRYPLDPDWRTASIAQQQRTPGSMVNRSRRMLHLRRQMESARTGRYAELTSTCPAALSFSRHAKGHDALVIVANVSEERVSTSLDLGPFRRQRFVILDTSPSDANAADPVQWRPGTDWATGSDYPVKLDPHELLVMRVLPALTRSFTTGVSRRQGRQL
ncbi:MAG TPA: alpha-amylase family glycosyl hydrolase [Streptosporangiaceae bacterium]|nr:alpha-amylase family glycosyl hydrolase [Streptosporangiaceae bacterium]